MTRKLELPTITVNFEELRKADDSELFDELGWQMLARAGMLSEQLVRAIDRRVDAGLTSDQAVLGGLLVRGSKLPRGIFDATQADESEAHLILARCSAETSFTLRWLAAKNDPVIFRRFRAASFVYFRNWLERAKHEEEDEAMRTTRERVERYFEIELDAAGIQWSDVPKRPTQWGPDLRQRCREIESEWLYDALFASHSTYVHPSWHELRAFHLRPGENGLGLSLTFGGMPPIAAYVVARVAAESAGDVAEALPHDLDLEDVRLRVRNTVEASRHLSSEYTDYMARGGIEEDLLRVGVPNP